MYEETTCTYVIEENGLSHSLVIIRSSPRLRFLCISKSGKPYEEEGSHHESFEFHNLLLFTFCFVVIWLIISYMFCSLSAMYYPP